MLIQQFESKGLSHFSYAIGCKETHEVAIIDPERDIKTYLNYAAENRLKITHVLETHIHADFASGARELAEKTGAKLMLSGYDKNEKYVYGFPHEEMFEGDKIQVGKITISALHTPGHTPEHLSFIAYKEDSNLPKAFFSGDFLFIGSLGRPDLLGDEAKEALAHKLYHSVQNKLKTLSDDVELYPGHGSESFCGAGMKSAKTSTIGEERKSNPFLQPMNEEAFVSKILNANIFFPDYYLKMKKLNSEGPAILEGLTRMGKELDVNEFFDSACANGVILDVRHPLTFGGGHIHESINIGMPDKLSMWAALILPYNKPIYIVLDDESKLRSTIQALVRVGLDNIKGYLKPGFVKWVDEGQDFIDLPQVSVYALDDFMVAGENIKILDVRSQSEWESGHIPGAKHIFLGDLPKKVSKIAEKDQTIFCVCGGGYRSSIAASLLMRNGYENVYNVFGGMGAWKAASLDIEI